MIVVGIDPDADKYGVAIYVNGVLHELIMMNIGELAVRLNQCGSKEIIFSIEDVMKNRPVFGQRIKKIGDVRKRDSVKMEMAQRLGRCKHSQKALMDLLEAYNIGYKLYPPQKGSWANDKELFEKATGWTGLSNPDKRSAAFFGFLALNNK